MQIVREIYASPEPLSALAHRLPHKSAETIQQKGRLMGLKKVMPPPAHEQIRVLMCDGIGRTAREIVEATGLTRTFTSDILRALGSSHDVHIVDWAVGPTAAIFAWGAGENAARPEPTSQSAYRAGRRARLALAKENIDEIDDEVLDEAFRNKATWWPRADPVVIASINAMVHAGRASA
jgi:hypothetical protein